MRQAWYCTVDVADWKFSEDVGGTEDAMLPLGEFFERSIDLTLTLTPTRLPYRTGCMRREVTGRNAADRAKAKAPGWGKEHRAGNDDGRCE